MKQHTDTFETWSSLRTLSAPRFPYQKIKEAILGKSYELSVAFVGRRKAQALNARYRKKTYVPNVLSFPLTETSGEIVICVEKARREARKFGATPSQHILFLYIHGLLHLKGFDHGAAMEREEKRFVKKFSTAPQN